LFIGVIVFRIRYRRLERRGRLSVMFDELVARERASDHDMNSG
jgi:hypothetical protein